MTITFDLLENVVHRPGVQPGWTECGGMIGSRLDAPNVELLGKTVARLEKLDNITIPIKPCPSCFPDGSTGEQQTVPAPAGFSPKLWERLCREEAAERRKFARQMDDARVASEERAINELARHLAQNPDAELHSLGEAFAARQDPKEGTAA
jgi:hypothetical protein